MATDTCEIHECATAELAESVAADVVARKATAIIYCPAEPLGNPLPSIPGCWVAFAGGREVGNSHNRDLALAIAQGAR